MTRRRWIADEFSDHHAGLLGQNAAHLARVLRARAGRSTTSSAANWCAGAPSHRSPTSAWSSTWARLLSERGEREIVLVAAIYKFDRLEWAIEKCTELGVTRIVPVIARRTDAHLAAAAAKRVERWRRIAHEAAQQSRRLRPPQIDEPVKLQIRAVAGSSDAAAAQ